MRICVVYVVKEVASFPGARLGQLMGVMQLGNCQISFGFHELNQLQHAWTEFIANHTQQHLIIIP